MSIKRNKGDYGIPKKAQRS